ncbi:hypothetical protein EV182_005553, partial [Spiromyces aspiralis]
MKLSLATAVAATIVAAASCADAICIFGSASAVNMCKNANKSNCIPVTSGDTCVNLIGGPFKSAYTLGDYSCTVFKGAGCNFDTVNVNKVGAAFPWDAASVRCE